jgi:CheY-like chemotaxis protein
MGNPRTDWCLKTEAEAGLGARAIAYPRGRVIGGSSSINGMIYMRGQAADYDGWRQAGNIGWGWDDVLPYFVRAEDHQDGASATHGAGGEIRVERQRLRWDLLDRFRQADASTTRRHGGTGLGLAISKQLVEGMGGEIDFSSTPGQGSCFWFELPLQPASDQVADAAGQRDPGLALRESVLSSDLKRPAQGAYRLLLAEDNLINQKLAMTLLTRLGYEVDLVVNGFEALDAGKKHPYDAVLMDIQMPQMDGLEATQAIRALGGSFASLPIIALTANAMQSDREAALACGMTDFIAKPFVRGDLTACLNRWVSGRSSTS